MAINQLIADLNKKKKKSIYIFSMDLTQNLSHTEKEIPHSYCLYNQNLLPKILII